MIEEVARMRFKGVTLVCFIVCLVLILPCLVIAVAAAPFLSTSFYKNNGYGMGADIYGQWTLNTSASQDVVRVEFYLDNQLQQNDTEVPYGWSFDTVNYTEGSHIIKAIAFNSLGESATASAQRNFVGFPINYVVGIIVLIVVVIVVSLVVALFWVRKTEAKNKHPP